MCSDTSGQYGRQQSQIFKLCIFSDIAQGIMSISKAYKSVFTSSYQAHHQYTEKYKSYGLSFKKQIMHTHDLLNPLPDNKIFDRSNLKQIAEDILKCI